MLGVIDVAAASERRRANFRVWLDVVDSIPGVDSVYRQLPDGAVPYHFPVRVQNRAALRARLAARGIFLEPTFNESPIRTRDVVLNRDEHFPVVERLAAQILSLPVYQELAPTLLREIATELTHEGKVLRADP
jgi:dTDP-4-amino-4,6-dideoxygalactose transaminase